MVLIDKQCVLLEIHECDWFSIENDRTCVRCSSKGTLFLNIFWFKIHKLVAKAMLDSLPSCSMSNSQPGVSLKAGHRAN